MIRSNRFLWFWLRMLDQEERTGQPVPAWAFKVSYPNKKEAQP